MALNDILNNIHNSIKGTVDFLDKERDSVDNKLNRLWKHIISFEEGIRIGSEGLVYQPETQSVTLEFIMFVISEYFNHKTSAKEAWDLIKGYFRTEPAALFDSEVMR